MGGAKSRKWVHQNPTNQPISHCRLQQLVQNHISDNTNVLWNSPSRKKITAIGNPWFYKTTPFISFEEKNAQTHLFFMV